MSNLEENPSKVEVNASGSDVKVARSNRNYWIMVAAAIFSFFFLWLAFGQSDKPVKKIDPSLTTKIDDQNALAQAEQKLHQAAEAPNPANAPLTLPPLTPDQAAHLQAMSGGSSARSDMEQQAYRARMNQPSLIYGNGKGAPNTVTAQSTSGLSNNDGYSNFANSQSTVVATVGGQYLKHPDWTIAQGEIIHANLDVAQNTDLPGQLKATVSAPVYSYTGDKVLLPKGSRLIGQYSTQMGNGMATGRIFVMWNRIITPDGLSMMINSPGVDALGQAGSEADSIDHHFAAIFGSSILYTVLGGVVANVGVNSDTQSNSANQFQADVAQGFTKTAQQQLQTNQFIKSTLIKYQGAVIDVMVSHDVDLFSALASKRSEVGV